MEWDKDSRGLFSILELTAEEFETIRRALLAYRTIMVTANAIDNESNRQQCCTNSLILNKFSGGGIFPYKK